MGPWIKDLAAGRRPFADRLADRQSQTIPSEDPDYGDLGPAFPAWSGPRRDAILKPRLGYRWAKAGGAAPLNLLMPRYKNTPG